MCFVFYKLEAIFVAVNLLTKNVQQQQTPAQQSLEQFHWLCVRNSYIDRFNVMTDFSITSNSVLSSPSLHNHFILHCENSLMVSNFNLKFKFNISLIKSQDLLLRS